MSLPSNAVLLSFEGPDPYSMVGGLGTRATELSAALADAGIQTTLVFVGDPAAVAVERPSARLEYRRWCQWISAHHPSGVYDGEWEKSADYAVSVPAFLAEAIVLPAVRHSERVLVLSEDWQTAPAAIELDRVLRERGLRDAVTIAWNANNTYGFHTIDWSALQRAARVTTVSRYMKFELGARGVESLVIPNGIPERLVGGPSEELIQSVRDALQRRPLYVKVGRFDEDKRWMQAIEAFALVRRQHPRAMLLVRGGREPYGAQVLDRARSLGLSVAEVAAASREPEALVAALAPADADLVVIRSFVPEELLFAIYHVADAVMANSGKEPFGIVGLEVMASGGVAVTGSTGEEYAEPFENAIVCDTGDPRELFSYLEVLAADEALQRRIRATGQATAERYTWPIVLEILDRKLY